MEQVKSVLRSRGVQISNEAAGRLFSEMTQLKLSPAQAFEHWLNSDLKKFPTEPSWSSAFRQGKIEKPVILQVNCVRDVSRPAYEQLQKIIQRGDDENVLVDAENDNRQTQRKESENGRRMLHITFTDGSQEIIGMEYQPINCLKTVTPPGTKVKIIPPVTVRRATMVLAGSNVQLLGGRVAELAEMFSQKKLLASIINADLAAMEAKAGPPVASQFPSRAQRSNPPLTSRQPQFSMQSSSMQPDDAFEDLEIEAAMAAIDVLPTHGSVAASSSISITAADIEVPPEFWEDLSDSPAPLQPPAPVNTLPAADASTWSDDDVDDSIFLEAEATLLQTSPGQSAATSTTTTTTSRVVRRVEKRSQTLKKSNFLDDSDDVIVLD